MNSISSSRALCVFVLCNAWREVKPREYSVGRETSCMFRGRINSEAIASHLLQNVSDVVASGYYSYRAYTLLMTASITVQLCELNNRPTRRYAVYRSRRSNEINPLRFRMCTRFRRAF